MSINYLIQNQGKRIYFDYIHFLSFSCNQQWGFLDAIFSFMPRFGIHSYYFTDSDKDHNKYISTLALEVLSIQESDEINIVRLIKLIKRQKLPSIEVLLPYELDASQLARINDEASIPLQMSQEGGSLYIQLE